MSNKPADTLRDGLIKAVIWENAKQDTGEIFHSIDLTRSYKKDGQWKETNSFSGAELLRVANLSQRAYNRIQELRAQASQSAPQPAAEDAATGSHEDAYEIPIN